MATEPTETRWLLLIHQIPPKPNYLRVKTGRRLQRLGAVAVKNSVYIFPSDGRRVAHPPLHRHRASFKFVPGRS